MHAGAAGVPTVEQYLKDHLKAGQTMLTDGGCMPAALFERYGAALAEAGAKLVSRDVVSPLWADARPALPDTPCFLLSREQTGANTDEKLAAVRAELKKAGATALAVTQLDCAGWLLNLRAHDLPCTPLAIAYAFVTMDRCVLFLAGGRLDPDDATVLKKQRRGAAGLRRAAGLCGRAGPRRDGAGGEGFHQLRPVRRAAGQPAPDRKAGADPSPR